MGSVAVPKLTPNVETGPHAAKTVLVVEDEAFVCEVTCDILRHCGYTFSGQRMPPPQRNCSLVIRRTLTCCFATRFFQMRTEYPSLTRFGDNPQISS
jgi:hypothetical protein